MTPRSAWIIGGAAALLGVGVAAGVTTHPGDDASSPVGTPSVSHTPRTPNASATTSASVVPGRVSADPVVPASPVARTSPAVVPATSAASDLTESYRRDLGDLAGRSGVAIAPVGGSTTVQLGRLRTDVAWSTIKVPLAVAAAREEGWPAVSEHARRALTVSDNEAATALWTQLGGGPTAAAKVGAVLADAGDAATRVEPRVTRAGFTPFGQTRWSTAAQATTMAHLRCRREATPVLDLMRTVVPEQRWGLGRFDGAPIKGGWGPMPDGGYLVRQLGVIPTPGGEAAVSIAVRAPGGFQSGTSDLDRIARWLATHTRRLPGARCG